MGAMGGLDDRERIPQVDQSVGRWQPEPAQQIDYDQSSEQVEQQCGSLEGQGTARGDRGDSREVDLRDWQIGRGHPIVVHERAERRGERIERGRINAIGIRVGAGVQQVAVPHVAVHIVGKGGRGGE